MTAIALTQYAMLRGLDLDTAIRNAAADGWTLNAYTTSTDVAGEDISIERATELVAADQDIVYLTSDYLLIRLPWGYTVGSFTVEASKVTVADGTWTIEGRVFAVYNDAEEKVGETGEWRVTDAEWSDTLAELLRADHPVVLSRVELLSTLHAAFADRPHVKVLAIASAWIEVSDTRPDGLFVELKLADGRWQLSPAISPCDLRDIGAEPEPSLHTPEAIAAAKESYADPNVEPAEWEQAREVLLDEGLLPAEGGNDDGPPLCPGCGAFKPRDCQCETVWQGPPA